MSTFVLSLLVVERAFALLGVVMLAALILHRAEMFTRRAWARMRAARG